ncbi:glycosyltransferase [Mycolicibacterium mucogenicum]|nr:glycosyltransferase [Mycolicibacterium mucogenicum]
MGWDVTVYGRRGATKPDDPSLDPRITRRVTWGMETQKLSTLSHGLTAALDAAVRKPDVALIMNCANGYFLPILRARGIPTLVNVDGIEWERDKWSPTAKRVFRKAAECTAKWADGLVFDARRIEQYWRDTFNAAGTFIPYGGDLASELPVPEGLAHREYVLLVTRFVPENTVPQFFEAVPAIAEQYPVVIVGSSGYGGELDATAERLASYPSVTWLGHVHDDSLLLALWQHAGLYFHGHSVGGTNPALVQAMAAGAPILARDTDYNREVLGSAGEFVCDDPELIAKTVVQLMENRAEREDESRAMMLRAVQHYSWASVARGYDSAMRAVMEARGVAAHAEVHSIADRATALNIPVPSPMRPQQLAM